MPSGNAHMYRQLNGRRLLTGMVLAILTLGLIVIDLGMGSSGIGPGEVVDALLGGPDGDTANTAILWSIRLPMTLTCVFVGGSLSLAGLQIQTITNNALASPYTLGITASASFGAAIAITLGLSVAGYLWIGTALLALVFALAVSLLIFYLGRLKGMSTSTLILSGIIMNFFFQALQQYLQYRASPEIAQIISGWTFGNLQRSSWMSVVVSGCLLVMGAALLSGWSWRPRHTPKIRCSGPGIWSLGINVERLRLHVFLICSFLIAGAVGFIGTVAFVGLVAPHCAKLMLGEDQRYLLPSATILGGLMLLASSIVSKLLSGGSMLPVGIITSIVGVPFLFVLLMKNGR